MVDDLQKLAGCITDDPPDAASFMAHVLTGGPAGMPPAAGSRVVRMNPMISPVPDGHGGWTAPGGWTFEQFEYLTQISMDALDPIKVEYIVDYAQFWIAGSAPNQPLRLDPDTLALQVGHATFAEAQAAWAAIR